jgi:holo-[acyl-carrier protein] synthase
VEIGRIQKLLGQYKERFSGLVLTLREAEYASSERRLVSFVAGRWAAKEAVMKALGQGIGDINFTDIEILRKPGGEPEVVLYGSAQDRAREKGITDWRVSISHERNLAVAVAAAL